MWSWLSKIDPNTVIALVTAVLALAYHLVRKDTQVSASDSVRGLGKQVIHLLVNDPGLTSASSLELVKKKASEILLDLAKRAGVPTDSKFAAAAIDQTVEHIVGDALAELRALDRPVAVAEVAASGGGAATALKIAPPPNGFIRRELLAPIAFAGILAMLLGVMLSIAAACGPSTREKTISATFAATNAAAAGFVAFDAKHQHDIVAAAPDRAHGEAELAAWRDKQATIERAFTATYRAIAAAATANDDPSVAGMLAAASQLQAALHALGVSP